MLWKIGQGQGWQLEQIWYSFSLTKAQRKLNMEMTKVILTRMDKYFHNCLLKVEHASAIHVLKLSSESDNCHINDIWNEWRYFFGVDNCTHEKNMTHCYFGQSDFNQNFWLVSSPEKAEMSHPVDWNRSQGRYNSAESLTISQLRSRASTTIHIGCSIHWNYAVYVIESLVYIYIQHMETIDMVRLVRDRFVSTTTLRCCGTVLFFLPLNNNAWCMVESRATARRNPSLMDCLFLCR